MQGDVPSLIELGDEILCFWDIHFGFWNKIIRRSQIKNLPHFRWVRFENFVPHLTFPYEDLSWESFNVKPFVDAADNRAGTCPFHVERRR